MAWTYDNLSSYLDANSTYAPNNPAYFWTVDAYEAGGQTGVVVPITTQNKTVFQGNTIIYVVRVWRQTSDLSPSQGAQPLNRDNGIEVYVRDSYRTAKAADFKIGEVEWKKHEKFYKRKTAFEFPFFADPTFTVGSTGVTTDNETIKNLFIVSVTAKKANTFLQPSFFVKIKPGSKVNQGTPAEAIINNSENDIEVLPHSSTYVTGIQFTKAKKNLSIPKIVRQEALQEELIALDKCSKPQRWAAVIKRNDGKSYPALSGFSAGQYGFTYLIRYYPLEADNMTPEVLKQNISEKIVGTDTEYPSTLAPTGGDKIEHSKKARVLLTEIRNNTCQDAVDDGPSDSFGSLPGKPETFNQYNRTNPPNHYSTRDVSHWNRIKDDFLKDTGGKRRANFIIPTDRLNLLARETSASGVLGMIFQDTNTAKALNADSGLPWGFRFIYNPTNVGYSTAMDTSIDWILATHDPANYIGGAFSISVTLYLNRVADMTELAGLKGRWESYSDNYPRTLTPEEVQGILHRGTEYDLEFLYRVVNGDPRPSQGTLLSYTENGNAPMTADFGYITGTPVWLKIHQNMRYKVSLASLSVNHVIFTAQMIPMFSTVDLQFIRYPVISELNEEAQKKFREDTKKYDKAKEEATKESPKP